MKKIFRLMLAAAVMASVVSCAKEQVSDVQVGQEVEVTFAADLGGALGSRAIADGTTVDEVAWAIYEDGADTPLDSLQGTLVLVDKKATLNVRLVTGKTYDVAFFAYKANAAAEDGVVDPKYYTVKWDDQTVTMDTANTVANDEERDCFWYVEHDLYIDGPINKTFTLTRPLAQLNLGVAAEDVKNAAKAGYSVSASQIVVDTYATFNLFNGKVSDPIQKAVKFVKSASPVAALAPEILKVKDDATAYNYLATTYILVNDKVTSEVTVTLWDQDDNEFNTLNYSYVPLQRNYRTNILGNLLTNPAVFTIIVDERFEVPDHIYVPKEDYVMCNGYMEVSNERGLLKWAYIAKYEDKKMGLKLVDNIVLPAKEIAVDDANKTFVYTDTDITVTDGIPSGNNWPVMSDYETSYNAETGLYEYFGGAIDGDNFTISGLRINHDLGASGFICWSKNATVDNLTFNDAVVYNKGGNIGESYTGIVIGRCWNGSHVNNVHITNSSVTGNTEVGALVGRLYHRTEKANGEVLNEKMAYVTYCTTDENTVVKGDHNVGGIVGMNYGCVVGQCVNNADVTARTQVGGIAGSHQSYYRYTDAYIIGCTTTAKATITATDGYAAAFAGHTRRDNSSHINTRTWIVGCASESTVVAPLAGTMVGNCVKNNGEYGNCIAASYAVTNGTAFAAKGNPQIEAAYNFAAATDATPADVDAMNAAIEAFNESPDNIYVNGEKGAEMLKRWVLTEAGPVLQ